MAYGELDKIDTLVGKTLSAVKIDNTNNVITFACPEGELRLYHSADCCESVEIESVVGDIADLVGSPIIVAEERSSKDRPFGVIRDYEPESETWTFYTLRTNKGTVDIRWHGTSNGYYSESVDADWTPKIVERIDTAESLLREAQSVLDYSDLTERIATFLAGDGK